MVIASQLEGKSGQIDTKLHKEYNLTQIKSAVLHTLIHCEVKVHVDVYFTLFCGGGGGGAWALSCAEGDGPPGRRSSIMKPNNADKRQSQGNDSTL